MDFCNSPTLGVALWGAVLSTLMALLRIYELLRDRFRIELLTTVTSDVYEGNTVHIRNLSNRKVLLDYWELQLATGRWPFQKFSHVESQDFDAHPRTIEPQSSHSLNFSEANYFSSGAKFMKGKAYYMRLNFAGHRSIRRLVYRAD